MKAFTKHYGKLTIDFRTASGLHIGDGNAEWHREPKNKKGAGAEYSVACLMTNKNKEPFIPGTSLAGVFRALIGKGYELFGDKQYERSNIWFNDSAPLKLEADNNDNQADGDKSFLETSAEIRKRTKVDPQTGAGDADARALFSQSLVPAGYAGSFDIEFWAKDVEELSAIRYDLAKAIHALNDGVIRVGADTTNGSGKLSVANVAYSEYDFSGDDAKRQLADYIDGTPRASAFSWQDAAYDSAVYKLNLVGSFNSGFITGSDVEVAEREGGTKDIRISVMNKQGKYYIPGSSIKGVLRHAVRRILNTVADCLPEGKEPQAIENELFGFVDEDSRSALKGRVYVDDVELSFSQGLRLAHRTPIDRFVGGVIDGLLLSYRPVNQDEIRVAISLRGNGSHDDFYRRLLKIAVREIADGHIALGGMSSVGNGYFTGTAEEVKQ